MTTPDPTQLSDWIAILRHPEVGERICEAAGCQVSSGVDSDGSPCRWLWWDYEQDSGLDNLTVAEVAALAFGTLTVLADWDGGGNEVQLERVRGQWWCNREDHCGGQEVETKGHTLPAAVLAAAHRVWCE